MVDPPDPSPTAVNRLDRSASQATPVGYYRMEASNAVDTVILEMTRDELAAPVDAG